MDYQSVVAEANKCGEKNDCAVRAVALAAGVKYKEALARFSLFGRAPKSGTPYSITRRVCNSFGLLLTELPLNHFQARTIRTLGRVLPHKGTYLVRTNQHILTCKDGEVLDHAAGSCRRIKQILRVQHLTFTK